MPGATRKGRMSWRNKKANHGRKPAKSKPRAKLAKSSK
jgi:hypothetical protein